MHWTDKFRNTRCGSYRRVGYAVRSFHNFNLARRHAPIATRREIYGLFIRINKYILNLERA